MTATLPRVTPTALDAIPPGAKVLWVSSTGGHLAELGLIGDRIGASPQSLWITFRTDQSLGFLAGKRHRFVDYVAPRDLRGALRAARQTWPQIRREHFDVCLSTGAAVAATVLPLAAWTGIPTYYVESLARPTGPSFTGKLLQRVPRVHTVTQYSEWASRSWPFAGSTFDDWEVRGQPVGSGPMRILVTLGTIAPYRFDRAVDAVLKVLRRGDKVTWQLGATTRTGRLPGRVVRQVSPQQMERLSLDTDVVIAHAGVGSILQQFQLGKAPVLAVRSRSHDEHVDDHQLEIAQTTSGRGLSTILDLTEPKRRTLEIAAGRTVIRRPARHDAEVGPAADRSASGVVQPAEVIPIAVRTGQAGRRARTAVGHR